jgi:hypothetical protein
MAPLSGLRRLFPVSGNQQQEIEHDPHKHKNQNCPFNGLNALFFSFRSVAPLRERSHNCIPVVPHEPIQWVTRKVRVYKSDRRTIIVWPKRSSSSPKSGVIFARRPFRHHHITDPSPAEEWVIGHGTLKLSRKGQLCDRGYGKQKAKEATAPADATRHLATTRISDS